MNQKVYLGLGSNIDNRLSYLKQAIELLSQKIKIIKTSSIYETPAKVSDPCPEDWNHPFLNMVLEVECFMDLESLLIFIRGIEEKLDRPPSHIKWSPRTIDIDILASDSAVVNSKNLKVPHPLLENRDFVLSPFRDIRPSFVIKNNQSVLKLSRKLKTKSPSWMDIINITPDSFSDGGKWSDEKVIKERMMKNKNHFIQWVDVGGYSTRPQAEDLSLEEEWRRIQPVFKIFNQYSLNFTKLSVDTFRAEIAQKALKEGVSMINDVSGLKDSNMISILKNSDCDYVLMHSLTVPADKKITLPLEKNPVEEIQNWLEKKLNHLEKNKINLDRIIFDPGIGFGKTSEQSLHILQNIEEFMKYPLRLLVGHSRKSFMSLFSQHPPANRDAESVGFSIQLAQKGVDILRVHNAVKHSRSWLAFRHSNAP